MHNLRFADWTSIEDLCYRYFGARPSSEALRLLKSMEGGGPEVRSFAERTLWLMKICRLDPSNISPAMAWWIANLLPQLLLRASAGDVPAITMEGRHHRIDDYLAANVFGSTLFDIGCAFPPLATLDTAARFPAWKVMGVDSTLGDLTEYRRSNLSFIQASIGDELPQADAVRCMNVLLYYGPDFRARTESWLAGILRPGGLFICGANGWHSVESRYSVYRNEDGRLVAREFAFSLDNIRPFTGVPWLTLYDDERETWLLAKLAGTLRSDEGFRRDYDARLDLLLGESNILERDPDGRLRTPAAPVSAEEWRAAYEGILGQMEESFVDRAVSVLQAAGLRAWRNAASHVAIDPLQIIVDCGGE
jgi:SAM-dependent methyltransferase